ncbi:SGNH/GDSL hydrolase family protein [Candidatus Pelagibacter sp.]|nr:SGNH/GDSL hydrolase family protein [Candidatus Pelagibacter sp.]
MIKKKFISNFLLFSISILTIVGILEIFVRIIVDNGMNYNLEMMKYSNELKKKSHNPRVGIEHKYNKSAFLMGAEINLNSRGFRSNKKLDLDKKKIFMMGDSMTFGWGSSKTFSSVLEQKIGSNYQVLNAGIGNTNTIMQINNFFEYHKDLNIELIILNFFINDFENVKVKQPNFIQKYSYLYTFLNANLYKIKMLNDKNKDYENFYLNTFNDKIIIDKTKDEIKKLKKFCIKNDIAFVIHNIPELRNLKNYKFKNETKIIKNFSDINEIIFIDSFDVLKNYDEETLWVTIEDSHANEKAHDIIGNFLYDKIKKEKIIKIN